MSGGWSVHVAGPDDILCAANRLDAMVRANQINTESLSIVTLSEDESIMPLLWATPQRGGCCDACGGGGMGDDGPCWDCRGTGHPHSRANDDDDDDQTETSDSAPVGAADTQPEGAEPNSEPVRTRTPGVAVRRAAESGAT